MAPNISQDLSRIRKASSNLNKIADEATDQIRALDEVLSALNLGIEVYPTSPFFYGKENNSRDDRRDSRYWLGYARDEDGRFGLVVNAEVVMTDQEGQPIRDSYGEPEYEEVWVRRLDKVSRDLRIAALADIPVFLEKFAKEIEETVTKATDNLKRAGEVAAEMADALKKEKTATVQAISATPGNRVGEVKVIK